MIKHKCFICLKDINNNSSPKICYCKGSIKSHDKCLRKYIIKYKKDKCDICKYEYKINYTKLYFMTVKTIFIFLILEILNICKLSFGLFLIFNAYYGLFYLNYFVLSLFFKMNNNSYFIINFLIIFEIIYKNIVEFIINIKKNILSKNKIFMYKEI